MSACICGCAETDHPDGGCVGCGPRRPQYHAITQRGGTITLHGPLDAPMPYPGNASGVLVWSHVELAGCDQYRPALEVSRP